VDGEDLSQCVSGYNEYTGEFKPDEDFYFLWYLQGKLLPFLRNSLTSSGSTSIRITN
jgi:hypothetical protein